MNSQREIVNRLADLAEPAPRWVSSAAVILLLLAWEGVCDAGWISELFLPAPSSILRESWAMLLSGEILANLRASLFRIGVGFLLGSALGVGVGLALGFFRLAEAVGIPVVHALYPIPKLALLPLIILWLGIGEFSKIAIIALGVFFPVLINTYAGVKNVDPLLIKVAVVFKASKKSMVRKVILPGALPVIFAGLKLAAGTALLLLVAAEMIAANEGIGAMILHYGDLMLTTKLMVGLLILSLLGIIFNRLLDFLESRIITWKG